jgi:DNA-binding response OmpR family regulator
VNDVSARILLVEDDVPFVRALERRLMIEGYEVACAGDGREGMRAIVTFEPELVISDWMMPHVDGLELCRAVKTGLGDEAPYFILLTAKDERQGRLEAFETGADDYLVKPCDSDELVARVRGGLRTCRLRAEVKRLHAELDVAHEELDAARAEIASMAAGRPGEAAPVHQNSGAEPDA